jgi:superfamily II DNA or RNA helicase
MKWTLRDEQLLCIDRASLSLRKERRTILCLGTGGGKTVTSGEMVRRALARGRRVWILVYRDEIMWQFLDTLLGFGLQPSLIHAGTKFLGGQQLYLGMVQTFARRGLHKMVGKDDLVVADEVHRGEFEKTIEALPSFCLGLSATPKASTGRPLKYYWSDCIMPVSITDLIHMGRLLKGITYSIDYDFGNLRIKGRDYDKALLAEEFSKPKLFEGALEQYQKHCDGAKVIVYSVNVERSLALCGLFNDAGIRSCHVDGDTERNLRRAYFKSFRDDKITALFNVGVATTGYDEPSIECVLENFATVELSKHFQCVGRGGRPFGNLTYNRVIDMGRNYVRHGKYGEEVDWVDIFQNPDKERKIKDKDRDKMCKTCDALFPIMTLVCPYCGTEYSKKECEEIFYEKGDTVEIKEYKLQSLPVQMRKKKVGQMTDDELKKYAQAMGHDPKWVNIRLAMRRKNRAKWGNRKNLG